MNSIFNIILLYYILNKDIVIVNFKKRDMNDYLKAMANNISFFIFKLFFNIIMKTKFI